MTELTGQTSNQTSIPCDPDPLWEGEFGALVLALERVMMRDTLRRLHGESVLFSSDHLTGGEMLSRCMVRQSVRLVSGARRQQLTAPVAEQGAYLVGDLEALPLASASIDGAVLHHSLERVGDPRTALREITRVLTPGGRLIVVGFNPFSLLGLRRLYSKWIDDPLTQQRLVNPLRLFDWLNVLGYELQVKPAYAGLALPVAKPYLKHLPTADTQPDSQRLTLPDDEPSVDDNQASVIIPSMASSEHVMPGWIKKLQEDSSKRWQVFRQQQNIPFGGILLIEAVKQATVTVDPWPTVKQTRRLAGVTYPRVASWERQQNKVMSEPAE